MKTATYNIDTTVHPLITKRFSPRGFAETPLSMETLHTLMDAARWTPSSYNEQPWRFIVARKQDGELYERILGTLKERNRQWAQTAPVLMVAVASNSIERLDIPNRHAMYDLGQAISTMTMQATNMDIYVHQMGGFDAEQAKEDLGIPAGYEAATVIALGYLPEDMTEELVTERHKKRLRKNLSEIAFHGAWGKPLFPTLN